MITPNSRIIILKTPMELDDKNQITFASATAQYNYFYGLTKKELDNATFVRKDNVIRFETNEDFTYDDVLLYNYCMYQNTSYGSKWFYAYITGVTYKSDGMSELTIKTDVYQTWCFEALWRESFIEREHIAKADDIVGANLIPENLETGDYVMDGITINTQLQEICPVVCMNYNVALDKDQGYYSANVYQSYGFYVLKTALQTFWDEQSQIQAIDGLMDYLASKGKSDSVLSIFMAPRALADWDLTDTWTGFGLGGLYGIKDAGTGYTTPYTFTSMTVTKPSTLNSYTPINKKLLTFPYCYFNINNNSGQNISYNYEDFSTTSITIDIKGVLSVGCSIRAIPKNYKGIENNYSYGVNLGKYPTCSWNNDIYTNWLTQNAINIPLDIAGAALSTAAGAATNSAIGVSSGVISIANSISSIYQHSLNPVQTSGNINSGDINTGTLYNTFSIEQMSIKSQFARVIDDYFNMYGYATHRVKLPNLSNRSNWNYIKTINANVIGNVPQEDLSEFRKLFNDGITLWHTTTDFLDYSKANN